jgi:hypothetical protein
LPCGGVAWSSRAMTIDGDDLMSSTRAHFRAGRSKNRGGMNSGGEWPGGVPFIGPDGAGGNRSRERSGRWRWVFNGNGFRVEEMGRRRLDVEECCLTQSSSNMRNQWIEFCFDMRLIYSTN